MGLAGMKVNDLISSCQSMQTVRIARRGFAPRAVKLASVERQGERRGASI
jgi:hypothetical protein